MRSPASLTVARTVGALLGLCVALAAPPSSAGRGRKYVKETPLTAGLGRNCKTSHDCKSRSQRCLKESDANGKETHVGFCALPCAAIDAGTTTVIPGNPIEPTAENARDAKKKPPPRCPPHFQCRSAGAGVPIDLCMKE